jgi:hypothetical protein
VFPVYPMQDEESQSMCSRSRPLDWRGDLPNVPFFFLYWGLNSGPSHWGTLPALFLWRDFQDRVTWTICQSWFLTVIFLISASWVARITVVSHQPKYPVLT